MKIYPIQEQQIKISNKPNFAFLGKTARETSFPCDFFDKAVGAKYKINAKDKRNTFFSTLDTIEKNGSTFRTFNFEQNGLFLSLRYSREDFIKDVADILDKRSEEEKKKLSSEFNFQLTENGDKKGLEGYPKTSGLRINDGLNDTRQKLNQAIQKFNENNSVNIEGEEELSEQLTLLFGAMPELYTMAGKKQNKTHDFTLDIHTLSVLQKTMNNPKYQTLSDENKKTMQLTALLHDISKKEGINDELHAETGAVEVFSILERLGVSREKRKNISQLIKEHEWLKNYNSPNKNEAERSEFAKDLGFRLKKGDLAKMEIILTEADMKSVKRDGAFFKHYKKAFVLGTQELANYAQQMKNAVLIFPNIKLLNKRKKNEDRSPLGTKVI